MSTNIMQLILHHFKNIVKILLWQLSQDLLGWLTINWIKKYNYTSEYLKINNYWLILN